MLFTASKHVSHASRRAAAMTLVELLIALVIVSIVSVAICTLTTGALDADRFAKSSHNGQSEVEFAMRRITNNIRESQTVTLNAVVNSVTYPLTTLTQADNTNGYPSGATVRYYVAADPNNAGQNMLVETDQRFGTNTIVHNVTTFTVTRVSGTTDLYQIDLVCNSKMIVERHFKVYSRN